VSRCPQLEAPSWVLPLQPEWFRRGRFFPTPAEGTAILAFQSSNQSYVAATRGRKNSCCNEGGGNDHLVVGNVSSSIKLFMKTQCPCRDQSRIRPPNKIRGDHQAESSGACQVLVHMEIKIGSSLFPARAKSNLTPLPSRLRSTVRPLQPADTNSLPIKSIIFSISHGFVSGSETDYPVSQQPSQSVRERGSNAGFVGLQAEMTFRARL